MTPPRRVLVTDDEPLARAAYAAVLARGTEFTVCGEARNGADAVTAYANLRPDVALMDLQMPVSSGIEATAQICARWPDACVVAMTTFDTHEYVVAALRAGAAGYLLKDAGTEGLILGLRQALAGEMPLSGSVRRALVSAVVGDGAPAAPAGPDLSPREHDVLAGLAQGLTNQQIGTRMYLSEGSVKQHLAQLGRKVGVPSRTGILIRAIQLGLVDPYTVPPPADGAS